MRTYHRTFFHPNPNPQPNLNLNPNPNPEPNSHPNPNPNPNSNPNPSDHAPLPPFLEVASEIEGEDGEFSSYKISLHA